MKLAALSTSTTMGSAAILDGEDVLASVAVGGRVSHGRKILPALRAACDMAGIAMGEIEGVAVDIGPGSFTGLRIGLAAAKGMALSLHIPIIGVSSLEALARNIWGCPYPVSPMLDARKEEVYTALYRYTAKGRLDVLRAPRVAHPVDFLRGEPRRTMVCVGNGAHVYRRAIAREFSTRAVIAPARFSYPSAVEIGLIALPDFLRGRSDDARRLEPQYLRMSDAEAKIGDRRGAHGRKRTASHPGIRAEGR